MSINLSRTQRRLASKHMAREAAKYPGHLVKVDKADWPASQKDSKLMEAWRSRDYLVQVYAEPLPCVARLSINRTAIDTAGGWQQDIPWTDLQRLKNECGFKDFDAVEVFPCDKDTVNVANIRHLWIMADPLPFAWRSRRADQT